MTQLNLEMASDYTTLAPTISRQNTDKIDSRIKFHAKLLANSLEGKEIRQV